MCARMEVVITMLTSVCACSNREGGEGEGVVIENLGYGPEVIQVSQFKSTLAPSVCSLCGSVRC